MRFQPGQSGNLAGRPVGARNKKPLEMEELLAQESEATVREILERAHRGEPAAMRLCMERMAPTGANRPVAVELPPVNTPDDVAAAARVVMQALAAGAISARETINLLTVIERLARLAERVQQMRERHEVWLAPSQASLREAARAALAAVEEEGIEGADLYSPVNSETEADAEPLYSPVNSGNEAAGAEGPEPAAPAEAEGESLYSPVNSGKETAETGCSEPAASAETQGESLYSPVNLAARAAARPKSAPVSGSVLRGRRRALMESVSPAALLLGSGLPVDPRSYVTDRTWLASLKEMGLHGATKRTAA
jgi:Family of unknown function (DUF5681)